MRSSFESSFNLLFCFEVFFNIGRDLWRHAEAYAFAAMSDLFDAIVGFKICVFIFEDLLLIDEDPVEAHIEEESSFTEWFSLVDFLANFAFAAMWDLFDAIVGFKVCVFNFEDLFLLDENPVEADME